MTENNLQEIESQLNIILPQSYREMLIEFTCIDIKEDELFELYTDTKMVINLN